MKIAFDVHGVLDTYVHFRNTAKSVLSRRDSLYIISGQLYDKNMQETLDWAGLKDYRYFSITQELLDKDPNLITWIDGKPWADDDVWNRVKADICHREGIDVIYDDSPIYGEYFRDIKTLYVEVQNGHWSDSGREQRNK